MKCAVLVMILSAVTGTGAQASDFWGVMTGNNVCVRSGADQNYREMCTLSKGEIVRVTGTDADGKWLRIAPPADGEVFISAKFVDVADGKGTVTADRVNVRVRTDINAEIVCQLDRGETVEVRGVIGEWLNIAPPASAEAWVSAEFVRRLSDDEAKVARALRERELAEAQARLDNARFLARLAERLKEQDKLFVEELAKNPAERDYVQILADYQRLEQESADEQIDAQARMRMILLEAMQNIKASTAERLSPEPMPQLNVEEVLDSVGAPSKYAGEMKEAFDTAQKVAQENPAIKPELLRKADGWVFDLGPTLGKTGATHKLTQGGKIMALIKSSEIDLKSFVGLHVIVTGEFAGEAELPGADRKVEIIRAVKTEIIIE